jgi:hypothetical protein
MIVPVALYESETWTVSLTEELGMRVLEYRMLKCIEEGDVTEG